MSDKNIICPRCGMVFEPFGVYMLEKQHCPQCGYEFYLLKCARAVKTVYSVLIFAAVFVLYRRVNPVTSVMTAAFWVLSLIFIKLVTYALHYLLLFVKKMTRFGSDSK